MVAGRKTCWRSIYISIVNFPAILISDRQILIIENDLWEIFSGKSEYHRKKEADRASYGWDSLLEVYCSDVMNEHLEVGSSATDLEKVARTMARESRLNRRLLGSSLIHF